MQTIMMILVQCLEILLFCIFATRCATYIRIEDIKSCTEDRVYHEAIQVTFGERILLSCDICNMSCDKDLGDCKSTLPKLLKQEIKRPDETRSAREMFKAFTKFVGDAFGKFYSKQYYDKYTEKIRTKGKFYEKKRQESVKIESKTTPILYWEKKTGDGRTLEVVPETNDMSTLYFYMDELWFRQTRSQDTGIYTCLWRGKPRKRWAITVLPPGVEPFRVFTINSAKAISTQQRPLKQRTLPVANLKIFTKWNPWSACDRCALPNFRGTNESLNGTRYRVGTCTVALIDRHKYMSPRQIDDFYVYTHGLPCRAHIVPNVIKGLMTISYRPSEIEQARCFRACDKAEYKSVYNTRSHSYIYRYMTAQESASFYIADQNAKLLNRYKRMVTKDGVLVAFLGDRVHIQCPYGDRTVYTPSFWYFCKKNCRYMPNLDSLDSFNLHRRTKGRLQLDSATNLIINNVAAEHEGYYYCFEDYQFHGRVNLRVEGKSRIMNVKQVMTLLESQQLIIVAVCGLTAMLLLGCSM